MKIRKLKIRNVEKIERAELEPAQNLVLVTGKNKQGKSSLLRSIVYLFGGKGAMSEMPLHQGSEKGEIRAEIGDYVFERKITQKGTYLHIYKDGKEIGSPQSSANEMFDKLYFDVLDFMNKPGKEQKNILLKALGIDLRKLRENYRQKYEKRREVGIQRREYENKIKGDKPDSKYFDMKTKSSSDILKKLDAVRENIDNASSLDSNINLEKQSISEKEDHITECKEKIKQLRSMIKKEQSEIDKQKKTITELTTKRKSINSEKLATEETDLLSELSNIDDINEKISIAKTYADNEQYFQKYDTDYNTLTYDLEDIEKEKRKMLEKTNLPAGIGITGNGLMYEDKPLKQASASEQLEKCIEIATEIKGKLQVLTLINPPQLDEDMLEEIRQLAIEKDWQIFLEYVTNKDEGLGVYIEDGEITSK